MFGLRKNIHVKMKDINKGNLSFQNVQIKIGDENIVNNINGEIIMR